MITTLALAAILSHPAQASNKPFANVELAFTCRYYKPGNAKSRHELYLMKGDGSGRRLLPTATEPYRVKWVGKDRLQWVEVLKDGEVLMTSKLSPWKPVKTNEQLSDALSGEGLPKNCVWESGQVPLPTGKAITVAAGGQLDESEFTDDESIAGVGVWAEPYLSRVYRHKPTDRVFFLAGSSTSTWGASYAFFSWKASDPVGTAKCLFSEANSFQFQPDQDIYAWVHHRIAEPLDPKKPDGKQVWVGALGVGSQKLGKRVFPVSGVAWATSVAIRPSR
jgi:hypothetical protein